MTTFSNARTVPIAGALFAALVLAGCASVPEAPVAGPALIETGPDFLALPGSAAPNPAWWTGFDDPELTRLVETALKASPVLRGADYSVAETEALLRLALLGKSPTLTSSASATASRPTGGSDDFDAGGTAALVIIPFLSGRISGLHAASFSFMAGVMPPMPMFGRWLL